jgi:hypothetical protein
LEIVETRRKVRRRWVRSRQAVDKTDYNYWSRQLKTKIAEYDDRKMSEFIASVGPNPVCSVPFWRRVNAHRQNKSARGIPGLVLKNRTILKDEEKAQVFQEMLAERFTDSDDGSFDDGHKVVVEKAVKEFIVTEREKEVVFPEVTMKELIANVKRLKTKSAPGKDGICNIMLKNASGPFLDVIRTLCNLSLKEGKIPGAWKESRITMIRKSGKCASDPNSYRPISLVSCLGKLIERVVSQRLAGFLEENGLIIRQQSGFRAKRRTTDNLAFFTQKISEALYNSKKSGRRRYKAVSFSFDIKAAFDTVWHDGLIYKMIEIGIPSYIILWVHFFLQDREFDVRVGNSVSLMAAIEAGVPQGSSISPTLFSVFINDIPSRFIENTAYTTLFADDLTAFFIFKNENYAALAVKRFLLEIESWLKLWRLKMAPSKCNYTIFQKKNQSREKLKKTFSPKLFGEDIPYEANPVSLGITFDERLNFKAHAKTIKRKCISRLNLLKIVSHKSWHLSKKTLITLYKSLIGSVLDYSSFMLPRLPKDISKSLQAIQNNAVRIIFKIPYREHTKTIDLCTRSGLSLVSERMEELNRSYYDRALANGNDLIVHLFDSYIFPSFDIDEKNTLIDNYIDDYIDIDLFDEYEDNMLDADPLPEVEPLDLLVHCYNAPVMAFG